MPEKTNKIPPEDMPCANCPMRKRAEERQNALLSRLWRWHTNWCPGWKTYQEALSEVDH